MTLANDIRRLKQTGEAAVLVRPASIRSTAPAETAGGMLVGETGRITGSLGGGEVEERVIGQAREVLRDGRARRLEIGVSPAEEKQRGMLPGGTLKFYVEPVREIPTLCIFGAGALAAVLTRLGSLAGFLIAVVDDDPAFASRERFPEAEVVLTDHYRDLAGRLAVDNTWYLVIATRNHHRDKRVLKQAVYLNAAYVGILFSRKKKDAFFKLLEKEGIPRERLDRVRLPAGLPIGAATIEEMAVSIIAEIIQVRHNRKCYKKQIPNSKH
ncbi:MAG: XdhC/CoxI family protein [PVC group bacterium]